MIKLRLWGEPEEVEDLADRLESSPLVKVLQRSEPCSDRGKSSYVRVYMEVKPTQTEKSSTQ